MRCNRPLVLSSAVALVLSLTSCAGATEVDSGFEITQVLKGCDFVGVPVISGNRVVWTGTGGADSGGDLEIYTWTPAGGVEQLTTNDSDDSDCEVSGDTVVWTSGVGRSSVVVVVKVDAP